MLINLKNNMKKLSVKKILLILFIISSVCVAWLILQNYSVLYSNSKIRDIEDSIYSKANQVACKLPNIPFDAPELLVYIKDVKPLKCWNENDEWGSKCSILKNEKVICNFTELIRVTDFIINYGNVVSRKTNETYQLENSDFVKVQCVSLENYDSWTSLVAGVREINLENKKLLINEHYNILMFGFDSLSKNAVIRSLPKSYEYLTKNLKADVLQGYNIVGDGTPQALIPILTGFTELELPETRKRIKFSNSVNVYPFIWKDYEKYGFVTSFNEDTPHIGAFSYRLKGFNEQPTDHYMRTLYQEAGRKKKYCDGHKSSHQLMLDYTKNLSIKYQKHPYFIFSFHGGLSHDSIILITLADNDIVDWLKSLEILNILNNTILIFMSDHGNRFAKIRNTLQGKQEERLPFFSFRFPESFKINYKNEYNNFQKNLNRLTTPFDIHATLQHILELQVQGSTETNLKKSRSISLLNQIPEDRSCADAYIEPHWCTCLQWDEINKTSTEIIESVKVLIEFLNNYTNNYRKICEKLILYKINYAVKLNPKESLINFIKTNDRDGFQASFRNGNKKIIIREMYQVTVTLNPGLSIFEATVTHDLKKNKYSVKLSDISRINKYGDQARCVYDINPDLRKYCYCKN